MTSVDTSQTIAPRHRWWSLSVVSLGTFMVTTDIGLLSIALPAIMTDLHADLALAGWIALIYALVTAALYLPCGRLSDMIGRARVYRIGFFLYAVTSLIAGFAQDGWQLILFRGLQAVGSALIMTNSFAMLTAIFPPEERGRAMGIAGGTVSALGYTLGPVIGGLLTYTLGWRSNFYLTAALAAAGFAAARCVLRDDAPGPSGGTVRKSFDFVGTLSFGMGVSALLLGLTAGQKAGWTAATTLSELGIGLGSLIFFVWWEARSRFPLLDLRLFRIRAFTYGNIARLISFMAISLNNLIMPLFLQLAMGLDPLHAGLLVAPTSLGLALLAPLAGWLSEKVSVRVLTAAGLSVKAIACAFLSSLSINATSFDLILRLGLLGVGLGIFQTPNNNSLMSSLPRERLSVGSSFLSVIRSLGHSSGAALATTIVSARLFALTGQGALHDLKGAAGTSGNPILPAFMEGFRYAYVAAAVLCLLGSVVSALPNDAKPKRTAS
ncbi:MAG: DHA2 family efflux MFS transporter permease subunit [Candidatus Binatia bacterium]